MTKNEISKDFRSMVTKLENNLKSVADGENVIVGTKENPIITNNERIPIRQFFMDGVYVIEMNMFKNMVII